jgi:hypothetical protein
MDKVGTTQITGIIVQLQAIDDHYDLYNADVAVLMEHCLKGLKALEKEVLYAEFRADMEQEVREA